MRRIALSSVEITAPQLWVIFGLGVGVLLFSRSCILEHDYEQAMQQGIHCDTYFCIIVDPLLYLIFLCSLSYARVELIYWSTVTVVSKLR